MSEFVLPLLAFTFISCCPFFSNDCSINSSRILESGDLCSEYLARDAYLLILRHITYYFLVSISDIDRMVRMAIANMGNFVPKEVKELSSNYPKPVSCQSTIEELKVLKNKLSGSRMWPLLLP